MRDSAHRFAERELRPAGQRLDRVHNDDAALDSEIVAAIERGAAIGLSSILVPESHGGFGGGLLDLVLAIEELAWGDAGLAGAFIINNTLSLVLQRGAAEPMRTQWLRALASPNSPAFILAGAVSEPTGGSEVFCPLPDPRLGVRTVAQADPDGWRIEGRKVFTSNGGIASLYIVLARTDRGAPNMLGCSAFAVPARTPGLSFGRNEDKMGYRGSVTRESIFDGVHVAADHLLGVTGAGFHVLLDIYAANSVAVAAMAVGLARAAYEAALDYARGRQTWGQPILQHESVGGRLVRMKARLEAARALTWRTAWEADHPEQGTGLAGIASIAKIEASECARAIAIDALDVFGGYGYTREFPIEKLLRDALIFPIFDGTNDVLARLTAPRL